MYRDQAWGLGFGVLCSAPDRKNHVMNYWKHVLQYLKELVELLQDLRNLQQQTLVHKEDELLTKQDVIARLRISDTTYRRYVKAGRLKPMRLHGIDMYREEDLGRELDESRRKGRL